jgi:hypothetical protein
MGMCVCVSVSDIFDFSAYHASRYKVWDMERELLSRLIFVTGVCHPILVTS